MAQETKSVTKHERRRDKQARYEDSKSAAYSGLDDYATDEEVAFAVGWAEEHGMKADAVLRSLRKFRRHQAIRADGWDPNRDAVELPDYTGGGVMLGMDLDLGKTQARARRNKKDQMRRADAGEKGWREAVPGEEICKRQHSTKREQEACDKRNEEIRRIQAEREAEERRERDRARRNRAAAQRRAAKK